MIPKNKGEQYKLSDPFTDWVGVGTYTGNSDKVGLLYEFTIVGEDENETYLYANKDIIALHSYADGRELNPNEDFVHRVAELINGNRDLLDRLSKIEQRLLDLGSNQDGAEYRMNCLEGEVERLKDQLLQTEL